MITCGRVHGKSGSPARSWKQRTSPCSKPEHFLLNGVGVNVKFPTGADTKKSLLAASVFCHNHEAVRVRYNDLLAPPLHESLILPGT